MSSMGNVYPSSVSLIFHQELLLNSTILNTVAMVVLPLHIVHINAHQLRNFRTKVAKDLDEYSKTFAQNWIIHTTGGFLHKHSPIFIRFRLLLSLLIFIYAFPSHLHDVAPIQTNICTMLYGRSSLPYRITEKWLTWSKLYKKTDEV